MMGWVKSWFLEKRKANESWNWDSFVFACVVKIKGLLRWGKDILIWEQGGSVGKGSSFKWDVRLYSKGGDGGGEARSFIPAAVAGLDIFAAETLIHAPAERQLLCTRHS